MDNEIRLNKKERRFLNEYKKTGGHSFREFNRATIFSFLDKGLNTSEIENLLDVDRTTIWRLKKKYLEFGLEEALAEKKRPGQPLKYTTYHDAKLVALIGGPAPAGRTRWTIRLLVEELHKQKGFETITYGSVRMILKKNNLSLD